jgi:hypothetical protein
MLFRTKPITMKAASAVLKTMALPSAGPFQTLDPFLFCVYHKDAYPPAHDDTMEAPQRGNGMDFDPSAPYRMYHGESKNRRKIFCFGFYRVSHACMFMLFFKT